MTTEMSSRCIILDSPVDACNASIKSKEHHDQSPFRNNKKKRTAGYEQSSIGLGLVVTKHERKKPPSSITLPPAPTIVFDSGTPQNTTTFSFPRHIIPLPSPSSVGDQPTFTKHDIISPSLPTSIQLTTPDEVDQQEEDDDSYIPVISLSPSFSSSSQQQQRMPNLSELPILGDIDDDHFQDIGSLSVPPLMMNTTMMREQQSLLSPAIRTYDEASLIGKSIWKFRINQLLGVGAFSKVYLVTHMDKENTKSAIKMIRKSKMLKDLRMKSSVEREVAVLQFLHHPGIVQLEATMEIEQHLCLVLEYVNGGELFDFVQKRYMHDDTGQIKQDLVKDLYSQLATVVQWMHEQNVVHRDLKLENILLYDKCGQLKLKITDFGLARVIDPEKPLLSTRCGSEEYAAPEIVQGIGYDGRLTDTWATGVILYALLVGYLPFSARDGSTTSQLFYQIIQASIRWPKDIDIPDQAKQVVNSLLHRQPDKRISLLDILSLPWFST
ncbi:kinase-like domain-containing protein [Halteromyces radiatus]|uniref:kinase-like domain-containing protein n=1 Tax=Halteromyces radiatus TaxID=101107 RepID=UPI00221F202C|nr:kinase-like domain-containing protein [Halteromyces radiatus]KAI8092738.1 kinase-like domain-containing protein [Halteromyces radiatus]